MDKQLSDDELQKLLAQHEEYQARAEVLAGQMEAITASIVECERAVNTIDTLEDVNEDTMSFVPIGAGSFVHARLMKSDRAIVSLGAGVSADMSADAARQCLTDRREKLTKILEQMNKTFQDLAQTIQAVQIEANRQVQARQTNQAYI